MRDSSERCGDALFSIINWTHPGRVTSVCVSKLDITGSNKVWQWPTYCFLCPVIPLCYHLIRVLAQLFLFINKTIVNDSKPGTVVIHRCDQPRIHAMPHAKNLHILLLSFQSWHTSFKTLSRWRNIKGRWIPLIKGHFCGKHSTVKSLLCYTVQLRLGDHATAHSIDGKFAMKHIAVLVINKRLIDDHTSRYNQQYDYHTCWFFGDCWSPGQ